MYLLGKNVELESNQVHNYLAGALAEYRNREEFTLSEAAQFCPPCDKDDFNFVEMGQADRVDEKYYMRSCVSVVTHTSEKSKEKVRDELRNYIVDYVKDKLAS